MKCYWDLLIEKKKLIEPFLQSFLTKYCTQEFPQGMRSQKL